MSEDTIDYKKLAEALAEALEQRNLWIEGEEYRELVILRMRLSNKVESLAEELEAANARIAELEAFIDQLIEIGEWGVTGMVIATSFSVGKIHDLAERRQNEWLTLVKDWKEREDSE